MTELDMLEIELINLKTKINERLQYSIIVGDGRCTVIQAWREGIDMAIGELEKIKSKRITTLITEKNDT